MVLENCGKAQDQELPTVTDGRVELANKNDLKEEFSHRTSWIFRSLIVG